jgi:raffinose/stachyose/melibiose transport system substrate-binding protein
MMKAWARVGIFGGPLLLVAAYVWSVITVAARSADPVQHGTILRISHWKLESGMRAALADIIAQYEAEHPGVHIVQNPIPYPTYGQWISTQLMAGTAPDIIEMGNGTLPEHVWLSYFNRHLVPLSKPLSQANPYNRGSDLESVPWRQTFVDDGQCGYRVELQDYFGISPSLLSVRLYYNKTLLQRLTGLSASPSDYRGFLATCAQIGAQRDDQGRAFIPIVGSRYHFPYWDLRMFDLLTSSALGKIDFNRDGFVGSDEFYFAFSNKRIDLNFPAYRAKFDAIRAVSAQFSPGWTGLDRDDGVFQFAQQRAVYMGTGTWDAKDLEKQAKGKFEIGMINYPWPDTDDPQFGPVMEGPRYESLWPGMLVGVTRSSAHQDIALDFLKFLCARRPNKQLNQATGFTPNISGVEVEGINAALEKHSEGVTSSLPAPIGSRTSVAWEKLYSLFKLGDLGAHELAEQFAAAYKTTAPEDFAELQRDWRRALIANEQMLSGVRAKALRGGEGSQSAWIKYRALSASRQIFAEIDHARTARLSLDRGSEQTRDPYEYSPEVLQQIRSRLRNSQDE